MINIEDLKACADCGTVYYGKFSKEVCPKCHTNDFEKVSGYSP